MNVNILAEDSSGTYCLESRMKSNPLSFKQPYRTEIHLYKFDGRNTLSYEKNFHEDLKDYEFHSIQSLDNDLYLFATQQKKREKVVKLLCGRLDKSTGNLINGFKELGANELEEKDDLCDIEIKKIENGKLLLITMQAYGNDSKVMKIKILDKELNETVNATILTDFGFAIKYVFYTADKKLGILGLQRVTESVTRKKKSIDWSILKQFEYRIYSPFGRIEKSVTINAGKYYITNHLTFEQSDGVIVASGFFCDNNERKNVAGIFVHKIDESTGEIILNSLVEINSDMVKRSINFETDSLPLPNGKNIFNSELQVHSIYHNSKDNSFIVAGELASNYSARETTGFRNGNGEKVSSSSDVYFNARRDIILIGINSKGEIMWMNAIGKNQIESVTYGSAIGSFTYGAYYQNNGEPPYYASFYGLLRNQKLVILLNDVKENISNPGYGTQAPLEDFRRTNLYAITVDFTTGKMHRTIIGENSKESIFTPRHTFLSKDNDKLIIPAWRTHYAASSDFRFGTLTIQ